MKFMLGANYWGRDYATEMWRHYDGARIREEFKQLSEYGVQCLRVFPNWRDFQPVDMAYRWRGKPGEYINANTGMPIYGDGVDMQQIANFRDLCHAAEENGITLVVSIVTGWMSGRLYTPPAIAGKNLITDTEALTWMRRYIRRLVRELKDEKAIVMWDLGNECNCMGFPETTFDAYNWTAAVADTIRAVDNSRPISSGMHALATGESNDMKWLLQDQAELTDVLTPHPYPSPTYAADREPYTRLKVTFLPTAVCLYYAGVGKKDVYIQESGTFTQSQGHKNMSADFMRIQILSSIANNLIGYQWWCAWEQKHLNFPPYTWSLMEQELGMFNADHSPKPVAHVMKSMSELINKLPERMPQRTIDGVCILTEEQDRQKMAISSLTLAKQIGLDLEVCYTNSANIPDSKLYFMPCVSGWNNINSFTWDAIMNKVKNGATLCMTYGGGFIGDFPETVGAESTGVMTGGSHTFEIDGKKMYYSGKEIYLDPTTAEVLLRNEQGKPLMLKNRVGEGYVYFVDCALEAIAFDLPGSFNNIPYYKIYEIAAKDFIGKKPVSCNDANVFVTVHPCDDNSCYATVLNYSDHEIVEHINVKEGWKVAEVIYGELDRLPACNGTILKLVKE